MRNRFWRVCPLRLYLALAVSAALCFLPRAASAEKVTLLLDWVPYGKHAWQYAALDLGLFKKAGLEVKIIRGFGVRRHTQKGGYEKRRVRIRGLWVPRPRSGQRGEGEGNGCPASQGALQQSRPVGLRHQDREGLRGEATGRVARQLSDRPVAGVREAGGIQTQARSSRCPCPPLPSPLPSCRIRSTSPPNTAPSVSSCPRWPRSSGRRSSHFSWADYGIDIYANGNITHDDLIKKPAGSRPPSSRRRT